MDLENNQFFLVVNSSGEYLKTSFEEDFEEIKTWKGVLFAKEQKQGLHGKRKKELWEKRGI